MRRTDARREISHLTRIFHRDPKNARPVLQSTPRSVIAPERLCSEERAPRCRLAARSIRQNFFEHQTERKQIAGRARAVRRFAQPRATHNAAFRPAPSARLVESPRSISEHPRFSTRSCAGDSVHQNIVRASRRRDQTCPLRAARPARALSAMRDDRCNVLSLARLRFFRTDRDDAPSVHSVAKKMLARRSPAPHRHREFLRPTFARRDAAAALHALRFGSLLGSLRS